MDTYISIQGYRLKPWVGMILLELTMYKHDGYNYIQCISDK